MNCIFKKIILVLVVCLFAPLGCSKKPVPMKPQLEKQTLNEKKANISIEVQYPKIKNEAEHPSFKKFNTHVKKVIDQQVKYFQAGLKKLELSEDLDYFLNINYKLYEAPKGYISLLFSQSDYTGGAHPNLYLFTINFDLKADKFLLLKDLFKKNNDYLRQLSEYSKSKFLNQLKHDPEFPSDEDWVARGTQPQDSSFAAFNLTQKGLVLHFQNYQVAAYVAGPQEILIPIDQLDLHGSSN